MNSLSETTLYHVLERQEKGESIEKILAQFPDQSLELRKFLETVTQMKQLPTQPSLGTQQHARNAFLNRVPAPQTSWFTRPVLQRGLLFATGMMGLFLVLGSTLLSASASALPGDTLYSVKRVTELFRLATTLNSAKATILEENFQRERVQEIEQLLQSGRNEKVAFKGTVIGISSKNWIVATLPWVIDDTTLIVGAPKLGDKVDIQGYTLDGTLHASQIAIPNDDDDDDGDPQPTKTETQLATRTPTTTPEATSTPRPTRTPTETRTLTATSTPTTEPTETATPTETSTVLPTITPTSPPAVTRTPQPTSTNPPRPTDDDDDDDDDGGGDDDDDGGGGDDDD